MKKELNKALTRASPNVIIDIERGTKKNTKNKFRGIITMTITSRKQNEMRATRQRIIDQLLEMEEFANHKVVGQIVEGVLLKNEDGYTVLKPIVKKTGFDFQEALDEFNEREENAKARAKALEEKKARAKAKKEMEEKTKANAKPE